MISVLKVCFSTLQSRVQGLQPKIVLRTNSRNIEKLISCNYCQTQADKNQNILKKWDDQTVPVRSIQFLINNSKAGDHVRVQGWVKGFRKQKKFVFVDIHDGLSFHKLPIVLPAVNMPKELNMHTSIDVSGVLCVTPNNPKLLELQPTSELRVLGPCDQTVYPLGGKSTYTQEYLRQLIHLRPKTNKFGSILRLRSKTTQAIHEYFNQNEFIQVHTPILTSNDCEGAGETFVVRPDSQELIKQMTNENRLNSVENDPKQEVILKSTPPPSYSENEVFFNKKAYLTVSSQLHLESVVGGLGKVWTFSPVFRAENQQSTRHLSEFYMVEAEIAYAYRIEDILEVMEGLVKACVQNVLEKCGNDLQIATEDEAKPIELLESILKHKFTIMTLEEAKNLLKSKSKGLNREEELTLTEKLNNNIPVFVIDWPKSIKPFYMRECEHDKTRVSAVDLLVPTVGELCGGSLREANHDLLEQRILNLDSGAELRQSLSWYLDLRKYGGVPSGGFGLGFDRLMQLITGIGNIKDVSMFPRWPHNCRM